MSPLESEPTPDWQLESVQGFSFKAVFSMPVSAQYQSCLLSAVLWKCPDFTLVFWNLLTLISFTGRLKNQRRPTHLVTTQAILLTCYVQRGCGLASLTLQRELAFITLRWQVAHESGLIPQKSRPWSSLALLSTVLTSAPTSPANELTRQSPYLPGLLAMKSQTHAHTLTRAFLDSF